MAVELILLQDQGQSRLLVFVADVLRLLIPSIECIALGDRGSIEAVGIKILSADIIRVAVVCDLVAVAVQDVVVHRVLVPDHGDNVGPAVDGDLSQALHVLAFLVLVPGAVVEPAFEDNTAGKLGRGIVLANVQVGQVQNLALVHRLQRNRRIRRLHVAVAVDHDLNGLLQGGVLHKDVGPAYNGISIRELIPGAVGVPLEPLVVGVAIAVQVRYMSNQVLNQIGAVTHVIGSIQHLSVVFVAVEDAVNRDVLQVIDHGAQVGVAIDRTVADGVLRPIADLVVPVAIPVEAGCTLLGSVQLIQAGQITRIAQDALERGTDRIVAQILALYSRARITVSVNIYIHGMGILIRKNRIKGDVGR